MNKDELKQLRRLLFLDVTEAAELIGDCESRTWQRWEKGDRSIPADVISTMQMLALTRLDRLKVEHDSSDVNYRYFETFEAYKEAGGGGNRLMWKLAQSVSAALLCESAAEAWKTEESC